MYPRKTASLVLLSLFVSVASPALALADSYGNSGDNQTLEEYSHLKDQEKVLQEEEKIKKLKSNLESKTAPPNQGYPQMPPQYGMGISHVGISHVKKGRAVPFSVYSVKGIRDNLTAVIISDDGSIFYAKRGDHLPGGFKVWNLTGDSVFLVKNGSIHPLGFKVKGAKGNSGNGMNYPMPPQPPFH